MNDDLVTTITTVKEEESKSLSFMSHETTSKTAATDSIITSPSILPPNEANTHQWDTAQIKVTGLVQQHLSTGN
jgi:hypothetical protein